MSDAFRAVFFGTPHFAVPCLDALAEIAEVAAVVCQPDRPQGRGLELQAPPVKVRATELGIVVHQPTKLRTGEFAAWLREQKADVALVVAYGRILPKDVLDAPRLNCVNVHASLLPRLRGAAPITWAVVRGEPETGITLMQMDEGMDTGAMLEQLKTPIDPEETAGELSERLAAMGALAVRKGLPKFVAGGYTPIAQDHAAHTVAPILKKEDGRIDWTKDARAVPRPRSWDEPLAGRVHDLPRQDVEGPRHARERRPVGQQGGAGHGRPRGQVTRRRRVRIARRGALARPARGKEAGQRERLVRGPRRRRGRRPGRLARSERRWTENLTSR